MRRKMIYKTMPNGWTLTKKIIRMLIDAAVIDDNQLQMYRINFSPS